MKTGLKKLKLSPAERDRMAVQILESLVDDVKDKKNLIAKPPFKAADVEVLFGSSIWGHREITLTIILARLLDQNYRASFDFYACNPRPLYEGPIRAIFKKNHIPNRKSGPLNVAKNAKKINRDWAANKHGGGIADTVVDIVKTIESVSETDLRQFARAYVYRYLQESRRVAGLSVAISTEENPAFLGALCSALIASVPDGGTTPQTVVGLLLNASIKENESVTELSGLTDSVSASNTTSKKPGDLIEKLPDGTEKIYEVTVKGFTEDRIADSHDSVSAYKNAKAIHEVTVICRNEDVPDIAVRPIPSDYFIGFLEHDGLRYYFINIFEWVVARIHALSASGRKKFHAALTDHVNNLNTSEEVKHFFRQWHEQHQSWLSY